MKLNKKDLLKLIMEQDSEFIDVSSIVPKTTGLLEELDSSNRGEVSNIDSAEHIGTTFDKDGLHLATTYDKSPSLEDSSLNASDVFSKNPIAVPSEESALNDLVSSEGFSWVIDPAYIDVVKGNMTYLEYLKLNPAKFLDLRIKWKVCKIIGYRGIGRGYSKDYYQESLVTLMDTGKGVKFLDVCRERFGDVLSGYPDVLRAVKYMEMFDVSYAKIVYSLIRPAHITHSFNKSLLKEHSASLSCIKSIFASIDSVEGQAFVDKVLNSHLDEQVTWLVQPNYKEVINHSINRKKQITASKLLWTLEYPDVDSPLEVSECVRAKFLLGYDVNELSRSELINRVSAFHTEVMQSK